MNVYTSTKNYFKESKEVQKAILSAVESLYDRIQLYERQNVEFLQIFNDDKVKYDAHGQFFTFKYHKYNMQLRILYAYIKVGENSVILIEDYVIKKKNNKKYMKRFSEASGIDPRKEFANAYYIASLNEFEAHDEIKIV